MMAGAFGFEIVQAVTPLLAGFCVERLDEIDSTNTELMRRARAGRVAPVLLVAERQTAGRGRLGRAWQSGAPQQESASLTFSLGLPLAPHDWSGLSLAVGCSIAQSLDMGERRIALKWPNDLWLDGRKLAGILIETAWPQREADLRYLVIGIGINLGPRLPDGFSTPPAWLRELRPDATGPEVLRTLAAPLVCAVLQFAREGFAPFAPAFAERDLLRGHEVVLSDGTCGHAEGVGDAGALLVRTDDGLHVVTSSEVSVRPHLHLLAHGAP